MMEFRVFLLLKQEYSVPVVICCVALYADPPHAFTDIYALLKYICVFAYIYCVYSPLYAKKNPPDKRVEMWKLEKKNQNPRENAQNCSQCGT